jgi:hypothetical protein
MPLSNAEYAAFRVQMIQKGLSLRECPGSIVITCTAGVSTALWKTDAGVVVSMRGDDPVDTVDALFDWIYQLFHDFYSCSEDNDE